MPVPKSQYLSSVWKDGLFKDKVVFCTGGNGSICSAQVRALVHLGANACIVGRNAKKTEEVARDIETARSGSKVLGIGSVDVRNYESVSKAVEQCVKELGGVDFLIAGAAGNFLSPLHALTPNAFKSVIDIDVLGSYNATKACLPHLSASAKAHPFSGSSSSPSPSPFPPDNYRPSGRIIYISATIHYTGLPMQTHVASAKAAVDALSNNVSIEYSPLGITSNVITPGPIHGTEGMNRLSKSHNSGQQQQQSAADDAEAEAAVNQDRHRSAIPLGRMGSVKDIADATVYLFSDAANYVTGQTLVVDGAAWRIGFGPGSEWQYPDFLLSGATVEGVAGGRKSKL